MHKKFKSPRNALILLTAIGIALVLSLPIRRLMPVASAFTLAWYIATHFSAIKLPKDKHFLPLAFTWIGVAACTALFASLPLWSILVATGTLLVLALVRWLAFKLMIR